MNDNKYITSSFTITPELRKKLEKQAEIEERSLSFIMRKALEIGLSQLAKEKQVVRSGFEDL